MGWPGRMHPGLHYMVLRETSYWGALSLGGKLHGASGKSVFWDAVTPPVGVPFRARSRIGKRTQRGLHMLTVSESLIGRRYGKFEAFYVPVRRSFIQKAGMKLPDYLIEDMVP